MRYQRYENARDGAIRWAQARLAEVEGCVVLDTETTDLIDPEMIEIAVIRLDGRVLYERRVRPANEISEGARAVHGMTREMLAGCPVFNEIHAELAALLAGKTVVSYNAAFDQEVLRYTCARHGFKELAGVRWECAMEAYARFAGEWSNYHRSFKWQPLYGGDHSAVGDCRAALERIKEMAESKLSTEAKG